MSKHPLVRRSFLKFTLLAAVCVLGASMAPGETAPAVKPKIEGGVAFYNVQDWGVEGRGWNDTRRYFDRLPGKAEGVVREPVWGLSRDSAGMVARFETDATEISVRYTLRSDRLAMPHMPATGVSGVDLYAQDDEGRWRWLAVAQPTSKSTTLTTGGLDPGRREYLLYLPLYNGVESLEIGVPEDAAFVPQPPRKTSRSSSTARRSRRAAARRGRAWLYTCHPRPAARSAGHQPGLLGQRDAWTRRWAS